MADINQTPEQISRDNIKEAFFKAKALHQPTPCPHKSR